MSRKSKYAALTEWLEKCDKATVSLTFDELNEIITIPDYAYIDRPSWANCTTKNATPLQRSWMIAGYRITGISLQDRWLEFTKSNKVSALKSYATKASTNKVAKKAPATLEEELLLSVPEKLITLTKDEYLMVRLTKENSDFVERCIINDLAYQSKAKTIMQDYFNEGNYSKKAFYDIINRIATENSTRTSRKAMECMAEYCADANNKFLDRLKNGDALLVDDLLNHLVTYGNRKDKSLASKVCRYLNEWLYGDRAYTINDSVVRDILPYYLAYYKIDRKLWKSKNFDKLSYADFYTIFSALRNEVKVLNNHQLDHLIWYAYKNDAIRSEIAKALAKVL